MIKVKIKATLEHELEVDETEFGEGSIEEIQSALRTELEDAIENGDTGYDGTSIKTFEVTKVT